MATPLMPKATAVWLLENTCLTFEQIAKFCNMHTLEIKGIADGEVAQGIIGNDPISNGQLTKEEIERCEQNPNLQLRMSNKAIKHTEILKKKKNFSKYTPMARRQDKPDAIYWIIKNCPNVSNLQITKLIGTTKTTIEAIRNRSHWNIQNIRPRDPVLIGICTQEELDNVIKKANLNNKSEVKDNTDNNEE